MCIRGFCVLSTAPSQHSGAALLGDPVCMPSCSRLEAGLHSGTKASGSSPARVTGRDQADVRWLRLICFPHYFLPPQMLPLVLYYSRGQHLGREKASGKQISLATYPLVEPKQ